VRRPSLQRRLLWLIVLPVVVVWLAAGAWLGWRTHHETAEMFDRELMRTAASVLAVSAVLPDAALPDGMGSTAMSADVGDIHRPEIVVRDRNGRRVLSSSALPTLAFSAGTPHFHTIEHAGQRWRVYQRWDDAGRYWIQVAAPLHDRDELLTALARAMLLPLLALLMLLPLATWFGLRRGLAPLRSLSRAIAAQPIRTPTLTRDDVPAELLQLTRALDTLVESLDLALARERRFTADAAHELRHPLSVLRLELDLFGGIDDAAARRLHLQRARDGLERMERLVAQLLTLARVESLERVADATTFALSALARDVLADAGERAAPRGVRLALQADDTGLVLGSAGLLGIAVRNLVDNAITHGRQGGQVDVSVRTCGKQVELSVADDGPGLTAGQAGRLGERFQRSGGSGSGLGLSIVQAIAALHHGSIEATESTHAGARLVLRLPAASGSDEQQASSDS
jgi:two-component system, OmpR family, sensor histidine kinase QseC